VTDHALQNARDRHNAIASEIAELGRRMAELRAEQNRIGEFIELWHEFAGVSSDALAPMRKKEEIAPVGELAPPETADGTEREPKRRRVTGNPRKEEVAAAAREIIAERGSPVSRSDLFKALFDRRLEIRSESDPEMVLSTMLWRMRNKVVRLKGGGYWLADQPWTEAGYYPGQSTDPVTMAEMSDAERSHAIGGKIDDDSEYDPERDGPHPDDQYEAWVEEEALKRRGDI
jgi:hypothetical protein